MFAEESCDPTAVHGDPKPGLGLLIAAIEIVVLTGNDPRCAKWMGLTMIAYGGKERSVPVS